MNNYEKFIYTAFAAIIVATIGMWIADALVVNKIIAEIAKLPK